MRFILIPALLALASPAWAEKPTPDFSEGLDLLAKLALPNMQGASWIKHTPKSQEPYTTNYSFREIDINLSGTIWKLADEKTTYLDFGSATTFQDNNTQNSDEKSSDESPSIFGKMLRNYEKENPEPDKPEKKLEPPASLAEKDAQKIATSLTKESVTEEIEQAMEYGSSDLPARILIFAAQLKASGDTKSANLVANAIFAAVSDDSALIDKAISTLADVEYQAAASSFFASLDWKSYETKIKQLLTKYPRGWNNAPALKLLVARLEQRSSKPPEPSLPNITIKPEAIALLDQLLQDGKIDTTSSDEKIAEKYGYDLKRYTPQQRASIIAMIRREYSVTYGDQTPWLLTVVEREEMPSPLDQLKAMRMDGLIALASVAKDDTLTSIPYSNNSGYSYYSYGGSSRSLAEEILTRYNSLSRPASRGEIAVSLLASVIPNPSEDSYSSSEISDPDATQAAAIEFWKNNQSKTNIELATIYIQQGSSTQQRYALEYLTSSKDPKAIAAYENAILTSDSPVTHIASVNQYLTKRKAAAKSFADAYIKILKENPPSENELNRTQASWEIREAGGLDQYLKKLSVHVGDISLSKLITAALNKPHTPDPEDPSKVSPILALAPTIQSLPLAECMTELGKAASKATPEQWLDINLILFQRIYYENRNLDEDADFSTAIPSPEILEIWKPLMAIKVPLPETSRVYKFIRPYGATTLGDAAAFTLELSNNPTLTNSLNNFAQLEGDGTAVLNFIKQRIVAYLTKATPEPWPSEIEIPEAKYEEIRKKLAELPTNEIIPYAKSLPLADRRALMEIVQGYDDEETPAPPSLIDLKNTITSLTPVFHVGHDEKIPASLDIKLNQKITSDSISQIAKKLLEKPEEYSTTTVTFYPAACSLGVTAYAESNKDFEKVKGKSSNLSYQASLFNKDLNYKAIVIINGLGVNDVLGLKDGKLISVSSELSEDSPLRAEISPLENLDEMLKSKTATFSYVNLTILTADHAAKIRKLEEE